MVIFCDSGDLSDIRKYADDPRIAGFTTNPSLMKKAGIKNYTDFAEQVFRLTTKPVSFEVLSDDWDEMYYQANAICGWGDNVWCKIPVTNTKGESSIELIASLEDKRINVTAVMTQEQMDWLLTVDRAHHIISVFMGRIYDANGEIPIFLHHKAKMLWASTRQVYSVAVAEEYGYNIITMSPALIEKLPLIGKDLKKYSLETVQEFYDAGRGIVF